MKYRLMTPGPTPVPEETLLELAKPITFHRTAEFRAMLKETVGELQYVFQTKNSVLVLTASGTSGMEAAVINTIGPGEKALLIICGRWGERWRNICKAHQIEFVAIEAPYGQSVPAEQVANALKQHADAKGVFCTFCETSTGVRSDVKAYGELVAKTEAIFAVDTISGLGTMECRTDDWHIDINVTGSQKALMLPPGLAYVSVSPKAWAKIDKNKGLKSFYLDLKRYRAKMDEGFDTPFTPANTLIKAQLTSLKMLRAEGIENVWKRHDKMARGARAGVQAMGLELFANPPADGLTVIKVPAGMDGTPILGKLEKQFGIKMANGQDDMKGKIWRMAHMGYMDQFDVLTGLSGLEIALIEAGHKLTPGVGIGAAQKVFAEVGR
jgi:aspartate aminotransferase-like enzyme